MKTQTSLKHQQPVVYQVNMRRTGKAIHQFSAEYKAQISLEWESHIAKKIPSFQTKGTLKGVTSFTSNYFSRHQWFLKICVAKEWTHFIFNPETGALATCTLCSLQAVPQDKAQAPSHSAEHPKQWQHTAGFLARPRACQRKEPPTGKHQQLSQSVQ